MVLSERSPEQVIFSRLRWSRLRRRASCPVPRLAGINVATASGGSVSPIPDGLAPPTAERVSPIGTGRN